MTNIQRQHLLAYLGYYVGKIDGIWGDLSKTACKCFQEDFQGIKKDGFGGPETDKALRHAVAYDMFQVADAADVTDIIVSNKSDKDTNVPTKTGTFWDHIRYWTREEFRCQCGGKYCNGFPAEPDQTLVELVDDLRDLLGAPGHRSSGLRCSQHNANEGGVYNSRHLTGKAFDFMVEGKTGQQLLTAAQADKRTRYAYIIGNGPYVHVDVE